MAKKSIVSSFGNFTSQSVGKPNETSPAKQSVTEKPKARVGAGIIGATKRSLTDLREERDQLLATVKDGGSILSLVGDQIDPSPYKDRLPDDDQTEFDKLKETLSVEGQIVPITVRRHPTDGHRYQTVYGHRRTKALSELGLNIQAILVEYSDRDLVVAQGIENASRQDLTWIEKALFCASMEDAGLKAKDIRAALSVDDAQLSKFRAVTKKLGRDIIEKIGRAPKIGRPRWLELIRLLEKKNGLALVLKTLSGDKVLNLTSDDRFMLIQDVLMDIPREVKTKSMTPGKQLGNIGYVNFGHKSIKISLAGRHGKEFSAYLESNLDEILKKFEQTRKDEIS